MNETTTDTVTLSVTLHGETREVEFLLLGEKMAISGPIAGCRIGNGAKIHRSVIQAWPTADGGWKVSTSTTILNRRAQVVCWADQVGVVAASKANSCRI